MDCRGILKLPRHSVRESILLLVLAACGSEHPTAPPAAPPPPDVVVDWAGLQRLYDDPLYRELPGLLDDESVAQSLDAAMSALVAGIHAKDLGIVKQALTTIHVARETYENRLGGDRHEQPPLIALSLFEIRGMAYIHYDSLILQEVRILTEDGQ
jgi:hypothetical protein